VTPDIAIPVIERMVASANDDARQCGGELAALAALEWAVPEPMARVLAGTDNASRRGCAQICAQRVLITKSPQLARRTLTTFFEDADAEVRDAAAGVAATLRGERLRPHEELLLALIASPAFESAVSQLLLTLEHADGRIDKLTVRCARRFMEVFGTAAGDIRTGAAGDAMSIPKLVVRALTQTRDRSVRSDLLDVIDQLVRVAAYGIDESIDDVPR
jgi:hypothetical protein